MGLQADSYLDMIVSTLKHLGRFKWTDLTTSRQNFTALPKILGNSKPITRTGYGVQWQVQVSTVGTARNVYVGQSDAYTQGDTMKSASVPWRHNNVNYSFYRQFMAMNKGPEEIYDLIKSVRHAAMIDAAELHEQNFWTKPTDSTDDIKPFGVPYWIVYNATLGLTGGNPSGFTSGAGGLDSTTYTQWKNHSGNYVDITKTDAIRSLRNLLVKCKYKPPVSQPPDYSDGAERGMYAGYDNVIAPLEEVLESQNENLGNDIAPKDGQVVLRRIPLEWVQYLDSNTNGVTDPIYGIDWSQFKPVFLSGEYMREEGPRVVPGQHTAYAVDIDNSMNYICYNRRTQFVLAKA